MGTDLQRLNQHEVPADQRLNPIQGAGSLREDHNEVRQVLQLQRQLGPQSAAPEIAIGRDAEESTGKIRTRALLERIKEHS